MSVGISGLLVEDERPKVVQDLILSDSIKERLQEFVNAGEIPHLLFYGTAGTGKTSAALAICAELGCSVLQINGSKDSGIDVLRTKIQDFAASVSLVHDSKHKVVLIDEADYLNCLESNEKIIARFNSEEDFRAIKLKDLVFGPFEVLSVNPSTRAIEVQKAEVVLDCESDELYEVEFENGQVHQMTVDHPLIDIDGNTVYPVRDWLDSKKMHSIINIDLNQLINNYEPLNPIHLSNTKSKNS